MALINQSLTTRSKILITYFNQHCFNIYNSNNEYKGLIDSRFTVFLDGIGIYTVLKLFGYRDTQRFNATDLNYKIFKVFTVSQTKLFLVGGRFGSELINNQKLEKKLNIVGYQPGYLDEKDIPALIDTIKHASPDVIVLAAGVPNQEILASKLSDHLKFLFLCVGGFLEFYFGTKKRAPQILRTFGLEWLYRLVQEPNRLWRRYIFGIPTFCLNVFRKKTKG
ncbi:MAG: WecB/TagA/CpsF family glycosyltransferase [Ignavibacteriaceae bacterium]|nr:WecB/TagA/CpsF family glycosyltransferase [Ignavibacteriaceae bacterium]